jgi:hypothetical protein
VLAARRCMCISRSGYVTHSLTAHPGPWAGREGRWRMSFTDVPGSPRSIMQMLDAGFRVTSTPSTCSSTSPDRCGDELSTWTRTSRIQARAASYYHVVGSGPEQCSRQENKGHNRHIRLPTATERLLCAEPPGRSCWTYRFPSSCPRPLNSRQPA